MRLAMRLGERMVEASSIDAAVEALRDFYGLDLVLTEFRRGYALVTRAGKVAKGRTPWQTIENATNDLNRKGYDARVDR